MKRPPLHYPEKPPHFIAPGKFEGWIGASCQPNKRSAMAIEMRDQASPEAPFAFAAKSADTNSTDPRAHIQALRALLEAAPNGSDLTVYSWSTYPLTVIQSAEAWRDKGWRTSTGNVQNVEVIEQILKVRAERNLTVTVVHCRKGDSEQEEILLRLHNQAQRLAHD